MMTKPTRALPAVRTRAVLAAAVLPSMCALGPPAAHAATPRSRKDKKKKQQQPTTGRIEVSTQPGGHPITIDGEPKGETTDYVRAIELDPGTHTVEIAFTNNTRWSQVFNIIAGRKNCIALNYRPRTIEMPPLPGSSATRAETVDLGDVTGTVCDCGEYVYAITPEGSGMGKKIKKPKKP
jgi:hypothetical protein